MRCPHCARQTLAEQPTQQSVVVDVCSDCRGVWLDRGVIYEFSDRPHDLEAALSDGLRGGRTTDHLCPRCQDTLRRGLLPDRDAEVEQCPTCGGLWFDAPQLERAVASGPTRLALAVDEPEPEPEADPQARSRAEERIRDLGAGLLALPNLFLRSVFTIAVLHGLLIAALIAAVEFGGVNETVALLIGVTFAALQFGLGPWVMDLSLRWVYKFRWVAPDDLPDHLREFVSRVCKQEGLKFPSFGIIDDGAPTAFTYGHVPSNARVVISRGILELLEPDEVEAVVAHELGHVRNWDMVLMTLAHLVPLLLFWIYRIAIRFGGGRDKGKEISWGVAIGAYALYIVSEYVVLWFSRTREYFADRFAGRVTNNPNGVAMALVKIAYGLASRGKKEAALETADKKQAAKEKKEGQAKEASNDAMRAMNIFDDRSAVSLVMASSVGRGDDPRHPDVEHIKSAMQWDLWNPWAKWYELHSTHPLIAKRLLYLSDQAAQLGQDPLVVFDRRQPESYWDDFLVDVFVAMLPWLGLLLGLAGTAAAWHPAGFGVALLLAGVGSLVKTRFVYRRDFFPHLSVAALMHKVKVSAVRPVPATLTGTIIGKGVPGLIWSEDFVLRDRTGILFMDYRQPLALWDWLFGLFRAGQYQGKEVRVTGWFRRAPVPFLEVNEVEVLDGDLPKRRCYSRLARLIVGGLLMAAGVALAAALLVIRLRLPAACGFALAPRRRERQAASGNNHPRNPMSDKHLLQVLHPQLDSLRAKGLYKRERQLQGPQGAGIAVNGREVVNFCANNYLGLANHPALVEAAHEGLRRYGYGLASVRFICGTQELHKQLEQAVAGFLGKDDAILYTSCFDANGGLFETLLGDEDAVVSDELNHASIIDGIRLCKAVRFRYKHADMDDLERCLREAEGNRLRLVVTDGVFSMDGDLAPLPRICDLAERCDAVVVVDDSHATGFMGATGRGTPEFHGVMDRVDIITSTLGKALGGAVGGFTAARAEVVDYLRQRSRPYLFSNTLPPMAALAALKALELAGGSGELRERLHGNARRLRAGLEAAGFTLRPGQHPIIPVMFGDATLAGQMADRLLEKGIYVISFSYPVVPQGQARIRLQASAAHTEEQIDRAVEAFAEVGRALGAI